MCARQPAVLAPAIPDVTVAEPLLVPAAPADAPSASTNAETAASTANLAPFIWPPSGRVSQTAEATILVPHPDIAKSLCARDRARQLSATTFTSAVLTA